MIIQHNIMALNSYNRLSGNNALVSKNLEKLSSGYKINRAADDAAGLAISEKMRAQITGLTRATQNSQDGISLVQTAEGNLTEVHSMLNRMVDLATQSSNGTYDGTVDRVNLQKEVQSLKDEINRIADSSHFNGIKLLDGSLGAGAASTAAFGSAKVTFSMTKAGYTNAAGAASAVGVTLAVGNTAAGSIGVTFTAAGDTDVNGIAISINAGSTYTADQITQAVREAARAELATAQALPDTDATKVDRIKMAEIASSFTMKADGAITPPTGTAALRMDTLDVVAKGDGGLNLQIGDSASQRVAVKIGAMDVASLGLAGVDISTELGATKAIDVIKSAINSVSSTRADLGAIQNRLEHTINNLTTTSENMTAAESRIRDTNMAEEMMQFTKNNVLSQAAQAMLAQANQQPQQVLQLLR